MRAFDLQTGKPVQRAYVPLGSGAGNYFFIANPRDGLVYVPTEHGDGALLLDELTGAVRGRVTLAGLMSGTLVTAVFDRGADVLVLTAPESDGGPGRNIFYDAFAVDGRTGRHVRSLYEFGTLGGSLSSDASTVVGQGLAGPVYTIVNDTTFDVATAYSPRPHSIELSGADLATGDVFVGYDIETYTDNAAVGAQLDERARRAFLVSTADEGNAPRSSTLYTLDYRAGRMRPPLPLGRGAVTLGVLPRAGRVLVLHHDDNSIGILDVARL